MLTLRCSLCNHAAGLILSCKVLYPFSGLQRSRVVVVRLRPEQRAESSAKGFNSQSGRFRDACLPSEILKQHRRYVHRRRLFRIKIQFAYFAMVPANAACRCNSAPDSAGRLHVQCASSILYTTLRAAMYLCSLLSDQYLAVLCSLRLRVSAVRHEMLSYSNRRR